MFQPWVLNWDLSLARLLAFIAGWDPIHTIPYKQTTFYESTV